MGSLSATREGGQQGLGVHGPASPLFRCNSQQLGQGAPQECGQLRSLSWTNCLSSPRTAQQGQPLSISKARTSAQVLPIPGDCQD